VTIGTIRGDFPALADWTYLNCGGMAPLPQPVGEALLRIPQAVVGEGPLRLQAHDEEFLGTEAARATVARFIGAAPDEIAFTTQFSTAINIVIEGLPWRAGDEIVVTDQEHPSLLAPVLNLARRRGLVVRRFPIEPSADALLTGLRQVLTDRTRLVAVSHVTTDSGTRLPAREIARLAHERSSLVLFDGAQALGQIPVDVRDLDCDFYAMTGYKWTLGPHPSAALYIRGSVLERVAVTWTGSRVTQTGGVDMDADDLVWIPGARRFEYGGRPVAYDVAMAAGIAYVDRLSVPVIAAHARVLASALRDGLGRVPGACVRSPNDPALAAGIVTVALAGVDGVTAAAALRERWRIVTRAALRGTSVRVSLAPFVEEGDVARLLESLATLTAGR
jgi:selenocysteine lyase/cysteine desulfurase